MKLGCYLLISCLVCLVTFSSYSQTNSAVHLGAMPFPAAKGSPVRIVLHPETPGLTIPITFQIQTIENYDLSGKKNFIVNVPAGSAAVIQIK